MNRMFEHGASLIMAACCAVLLGSCGSGAVTALDPAAGTPMTVSPATADLTPNVATTFTIVGGTRPYTVNSSNNVALPVTATVTGSTFTVTANTVNTDTTVDITVRDAANTSVIAKATVKAATALAISPPTVNVFADLPTTFTVTGGRPGYTATSSNGVVLPVTATITGSTFSVVPNAVTADTAVDITVRDAANTAVTAKATVKPSALLNQITFTPFGPTATGCGTNSLCSGGDAQIVVKAVQNGVILRNRAIRFDVFQGSFQLVTSGTGALVNSLVINTDEQGDAVVRITATVGAATQVATIQTSDMSSALVRRYNFTIVQQTSGAGILSILPSGAITITGAKGAPGADGSCPVGAMVDFYIYGGTPPYGVVSPLQGIATVNPTIVNTNGGRFTAQVNGCGKVAFIVKDATGRTIETSSLDAVQGAKGEAVVTTTDTLTVTPDPLPITCTTPATARIIGTGSLANATFIVAQAAGGSGFTASSPSNTLPNDVTIRANSGAPASANFTVTAGGRVVPFVVTVGGNPSGFCP